MLCLTALVACRTNPSADCGNGIYYWRTTFDLNDGERDFLKSHAVEKVYVKFFDIEKDWDSERVIPIATVQFLDSIPAGVEIVPAVYITTQAMAEMQLKEGEYADKILKRINAICRRYNIAISEIQLDCDWTKSTRDNFFRLCEEMKQRMDSDKTLSSTIRLHQLIQTPPPVDKGVLMVYNTGNFMEPTTDNSIFSLKDIEPYLADDRLERYDLPLDIAYPAYGWSLLFAPNYYEKSRYHFDKIFQQTDLSDIPGLKKIDTNVYEATEHTELDSITIIKKGYRIRVEQPSAREILQVKKMIDRRLKGKPHSNILYHLDDSQLSRYSNNEINKIYSCN